MRWLFMSLILAGLYPWIRAWRAVRQTSLSHALVWACAAWLGWGAAFCLPADNSEADVPLRYLALCLTACAGVAVLGARRPQVAAWNFVVAGLLAVLALPLLENLLRDSPIGPVRTGFLAATLLVVLGNFVPTSFAPAALLALAACSGQLWALLAGAETPSAVTWTADLSLILVPWVGWLCWRWRRQGAEELECRWLDFRDCHGTMWALRVREQFNHAAENAGSPVVLTWSGLAARLESAGRAGRGGHAGGFHGPDQALCGHGKV